MNDSTQQHPSAMALGPDEQMTDELCLFVLGLVQDGRTVQPLLVQRAREWAAEHPVCSQALVDFALMGQVLQTEPKQRASQGFTDEVLRKRRDQRLAGGQILPLLRRLSLAAALLLAVTLGFDLSFPDGAVADDKLEASSHLMDSLRPDPFAGSAKSDALRVGLEVLLPDPASLAGEAAGVSER